MNVFYAWLDRIIFGTTEHDERIAEVVDENDRLKRHLRLLKLREENIILRSEIATHEERARRRGVAS